MNENGITENEPKKGVGLLVSTIALSILLVIVIILLIFQFSVSSELNDKIEARDKEIKELEEKVEELKKEARNAKQPKKSSGEIDYGVYDEVKVIKATEDNGNIGDHVRGKKNSKVIVVEYADLQCPGCATMMPYMTRIYQKYDDRVAFVFRHFPIKGHLNARSAAAAAESAGRQGKYWEMLEALFSRRSEWTSVTGQTLADTYAKIFKAVCPDGDEKQFRTDMSDTEIAQKIDFDYNIGLKNSKVTMTPSIYVNGKLVDITRAGTTFNDIENNIKDMIEEELSK